jgi:hypothetical protein
MRKFFALSVAIAALLLMADATGATNPKLVEAIKKLGTAVDNVSVNISKCESDEAAATLTKVTKDAFTNGLKDYHPKIEIKSKKGFCRVEIETPDWNLWSEANGGKVTDHGAKIGNGG